MLIRKKNLAIALVFSYNINILRFRPSAGAYEPIMTHEENSLKLRHKLNERMKNVIEPKELYIGKDSKVAVIKS